MPEELSRAFLQKVARRSGWELPEVESLSLEGESISSLGDSFRGVGRLVYLSLARNNISSLLGIEQLPSLATAIFRANRIASTDEVGRLACLPHLRNVDLRLNPIMNHRPSHDTDACSKVRARDGHGSSFRGGGGGGGSEGSRYAGTMSTHDEDENCFDSSPRAALLQILPQLVNLDGRRVTETERRPQQQMQQQQRRPLAMPTPEETNSGGLIASAPERRGCQPNDSSDPWRRSFSPRRGAGSTHHGAADTGVSAAAVSESNWLARSRCEDGRADVGRGGERWGSRQAQSPPFHDERCSRMRVEIGAKKRDRTGAGVARSSGRDDEDGAGVARGDWSAERVDAVGRGGRPRRHAPDVRGMPARRVETQRDPTSSAVEEDDGLAALWLELGACSIGIHQTPPVSAAATAATVPPPESAHSQDRYSSSSRSSSTDHRTSQSRMLPRSPAKVVQQDTRLFLTELDGSLKEQTFSSAARRGRDGRPVSSSVALPARVSESAAAHSPGRFEVAGWASDVKIEARDMSSKQDDFAGIGAIGGTNDGSGGSVDGAGRVVDSRREAETPRRSPPEVVPTHDASARCDRPLQNHLAASFSAAVAVPPSSRPPTPEARDGATVGPASPADRSRSQAVVEHTAPSGTSTAAAARAVEAFRVTSQRLGLLGAGKSEPVTAVNSRAGDAVVAACSAQGHGDGGDGGTGKHPLHTASLANVPDVKCMGAAGVSAETRQDEKRPAPHAATAGPSSLLGAGAVAAAVNTSTALVAPPVAIEAASIAVPESARCKQCGGVEVSTPVGEGCLMSAAAEAAAAAVEARNRDLEERWGARERDFTSRWAAREKEFDERWTAREREFNKMRREESKEFTRGMRTMLFEAHQALIASNAWLVQRLRAVELRSSQVPSPPPGSSINLTSLPAEGLVANSGDSHGDRGPPSRPDRRGMTPLPGGRETENAALALVNPAHVLISDALERSTVAGALGIAERRSMGCRLETRIDSSFAARPISAGHTLEDGRSERQARSTSSAIPTDNVTASVTALGGADGAKSRAPCNFDGSIERSAACPVGGYRRHSPGVEAGRTMEGAAAAGRTPAAGLEKRSGASGGSEGPGLPGGINQRASTKEGHGAGFAAGKSSESGRSGLDSSTATLSSSLSTATGKSRDGDGGRARCNSGSGTRACLDPEVTVSAPRA